MKAPDKIYLVEWDNKGISEYETPWSPAPYENRNCKNHKYIRKDIVDETIKTAEDHSYFAGQEKFREKLIEWASKSLGQVSDMGFDDGDVEHGYTRALQDIIDKINSL